jgi:hypothetical protein
LTVAAMVLLAVMVGGYALMSRFGNSPDRMVSAPTGGTQNANSSAAPPTSVANANSNTSATAKAFMRYHLLLSPSALDEQTRSLGNEPIPAGQSLQFSFNASEDGFLYMLGVDGQGNPVVMPLGTLVATAEVKAGQETVLPALAHIKVNNEPGTENFTVIYSEAVLNLPFARETLPIDGTFRKLTTDEQRKIKELRQQSALSIVSFSGGQDNGTALVLLEGPRGNKPVVFDIKLQLKR